MNVCGLRLLCREDGGGGSQISRQGKPGRPINAFKSKLHLCPKLFTSTDKRSLLQSLIRTNIFKCFYPGASSFLCARDPGRAGQRTGLDTWVQLGAVGSKVNSDFLFTRNDLRPLWFPAAFWCVCALVSVFAFADLQMGCLFHFILLFRRKQEFHSL